jgi:hypothetical protein
MSGEICTKQATSEISSHCDRGSQVLGACDVHLPAIRAKQPSNAKVTSIPPEAIEIDYGDRGLSAWHGLLYPSVADPCLRSWRLMSRASPVDSTKSGSTLWGRLQKDTAD